MAMAGTVFPKLREANALETYLGYKTEIVAKSGERDYQYFIREVDEEFTPSSQESSRSPSVWPSTRSSA